MVGDGVNDASALSKATQGVAIGAGGSEAALEAADITLAGDDLKGRVFIIALSRKTLNTIDQNFWLANSTNILGGSLSVAGLLTPLMAGLLHLGHSIGIMLNSARLLKWNEKNQQSMI
jgi:manganese/zinc-transporting P-type ATPase C